MHPRFSQHHRVRPLRIALGIRVAALGFVLVATAPKVVWHVGEPKNDLTLVSTGQTIKAIDHTIPLIGRPLDMVIAPANHRAYVRTTDGISTVDLVTQKVVQELPVRGGSGLCGIALSPDGSLIATSTAGSNVCFYKVTPGGVEDAGVVTLPSARPGGAAYPSGCVFSPDGTRLYVCQNRDNSVALIDVQQKKFLSAIPVDVAPFGIALAADGKQAYVTCWAKTPFPGSTTSTSSGSDVVVDQRGIGVGGTVCTVDFAKGMMTKRFTAGSMPTEISVAKDHVVFANANSDSIQTISLSANNSSSSTSIDPLAPGSAPSSLAVAPDGTIYLACGGRNTVVQVKGQRLKETDTPWYPIAVRLDGEQLVVATAKGLGLQTGGNDGRHHNVYQSAGALTIYPSQTKWSAMLLAKPDEKARGVAPKPIPDHIGEPSVFKHVVYVIKENRTYDQMLGDLPQGDGDPNLVIFGRKVTPNHHALAEQFVLLDNYYCNGICSADGHAWATEGNSTALFERSFGGWTRSYPFGDDPLSTSRTGFLWDDALDHGRTVLNFGEFDYASPVPSGSFMSILKDYQEGGHKFTFKHNLGVKRLLDHSDPDFPGWNMGIPDVVRASIFIKRLKKLEAEGQMADLTILYLPEDHTSGTSAGARSPRAHLADNDLALGQAVEAISHSKFWKDTVIFVNEDDPQDGFDHVDGHRSPCLVISPYTRRGMVVSNFYNQTSVLRSIEHILGIPPMNRFDASSPLMSACFQTKPDFTPYVALANQTPLDEVTQSATKSRTVWRLDKPDMIDDKAMNRALWADAKGPNVRFPSELEGAHGRGLAKRGLAFSGAKDED